MGFARALLGRLGPVMKQRWSDLLFAHWPLPPSELRFRLPRGLALDTFDGRAWIGITPFVLSGLRLRGLPPVPGLSRFPELNLRTYVTRGGRPGVWFFSLDAARAWAVAGARLAFSLPYFRARMDVERQGEAIRFRSRRASGSAVFDVRYAPEGPAFTAEPGSLERFLVERYRLYATSPAGALTRVEIRHPPWVLRAARAEIAANTLAEAAGIRLAAEPPLLHVAEGVKVDVWAPTPA